ncbi:TBP-associated factor 4 [Rhynchospora pubera]|uniref:TBP-associated factor 4 n=1 Tax=Rhynchospora pubera TaxID=906938 RepID=A0AAV8CI93_9POAL|nr:TBP-associated factor 4 [Rhynchospora pubera]
MDPSIVKLLEEDVDESMHSGADVDAFTAALNRDIGGDMDSTSGPSDSATGGTSQEVAPKPNEGAEMGQTSGQTLENQQTEQGTVISDQSNRVSRNPDATTNLPLSQTQVQTRPRMQLPTNQQAQGVTASASKKAAKGGAPTIPFQMLMPILRPHLDKDRDMQLQQVFTKLRSNEVTKEDFLRVIRNIVGDQMLRQAAHTVHLQMQAQAVKAAQTTPTTNASASTSTSTSTSAGPTPNSNLGSASSTNPNQYSLLSQATSQQFYPGGYHPAQKVSLGQSPSPAQLQTESKLDPKVPQPMPNRPGMVSSSMQQLTRPTHQHGPQGSQTSIGMFGPSFPRSGNSTPTLRAPTAQSQGMGPGQVGQQNWRNVGTTFGPAYVKQEQSEGAAAGALQQKQTMGLGPAPRDEFLGKLMPQKMGPGPGPGVMGLPGPVSGTVPQMSHVEPNMQAASTGPPRPTSGVTKAPSKKPSVGQKKPAEVSTASPPASKKQKTGGAFLDQSIEQLNDVTAVSGVNLKEEEEQLFSAPKEDSRVSEAIRRVVQEEEDNLILQKGPLHKKLMEILAKCNLKGIGNDVERCLSMCVEERLKGLIGDLIRFSKQRVDIEKTAHRIAVTSDVHQHILMVNKKAKDEWDQKQAEEAEKLKKQNEAEGNTSLEPEKDKDDGRGSKNVKVNKEEDDKMRTTAANVAARAAVGGDDMLSKWQLMAEQARQKREGLDTGTSQTGKTTATKPGQKSKGSNEEQEAEKRGLSTTPGGMRRSGKGNPLGAQGQTKIARNISVKDVISVLEREPQMSKSTLIYRLYNRVPADSSPAADA